MENKNKVQNVEHVQNLAKEFRLISDEMLENIECVESNLHERISSWSQELRKKVYDVLDESDLLITATVNDIELYSETENHLTFVRDKMHNLSGILKIIGDDDSVVDKKRKSEVFAVSPIITSTNSRDSR